MIGFLLLNEEAISDVISDHLGTAQYFSIFDLASEFHQIELDVKDRQKTEFSSLNGHYDYVRTLIGLKIHLPHFNA